MSKPKIVLVIPNTAWFGKRPWRQLPYSALILTALLREEFDFSIVDANGGRLDEEATRQRLAALDPAVVLVTGGSVEYHSEIHHAFRLARQACPGVKTVLGGVYATTLPEAPAKDPDIDWVFKHHAEERAVPFLRRLLGLESGDPADFPGIAYMRDGALVSTPPDKHIGDVVDMVKPDYSLMDMGSYLAQTTLDYQFNSDRPTAFIITSYGCPHRCVFCAARTISGRRVVYRPLEHVYEEIDFLVREHNVGNLIFLDDALLAKRSRITALLTTMVERGWNLTWKAASVAAWDLDDELLGLMRASGCVQITISVESGSQRVLKEIIHKPLNLDIVPEVVASCRRHGIDVGANFVIGVPGETWDEIRQTFAYAESCDFDVAHFHIATPLPGTDLYHLAHDGGHLPADFDFLDPNFFGYGHGFISTDEFTPFELAVLRAFEWDRINFSTPEKVQRMCRLYNTTPEHLLEHRRQTRRKLGVHF